METESSIFAPGAAKQKRYRSKFCAQLAGRPHSCVGVPEATYVMELAHPAQLLPPSHLWHWRTPLWPGAACFAGLARPCPSWWNWHSWLCGTRQTQSGICWVKECSRRMEGVLSVGVKGHWEWGNDSLWRLACSAGRKLSSILSTT